MPRRQDLKKILLIGSGPIQIGQACEFDYSGTQALKALKEEGFEVILVNSNPATIMTDPELSDRVYLEPLTVEYLEAIIAKEKPDAVIPTMGGQTALNLTLALHEKGILQKHNVEILGAKPEVIHRAEDRDLFKATMDSIGIESARSKVATSLEDADKLIAEFGLPIVLRPSFTLGGEGGGIAYSKEELIQKLERALFLSPTRSVLVEESLLGWKEYELEVVRDKNDNVIIICSIENFDPMGTHTGDSITVAPAQTLTDVEYQNLRDQSIRIIRAIGVETGGSNIQFSVNPKDGRVIVIEMNPRVSRSSALASKATGFPIARVAAKLAVGYTLDELVNDITKTTPCSFEPSIDYVVTKIPRFDFEKFRPSEPLLSTQMKSVGEVMAIGRTFEESLGKAIAGLEITPAWFAPFDKIHWELIEKSTPARLFHVANAFRMGATISEVHESSKIDPWFLGRIAYHMDAEKIILSEKFPFSKEVFQQIKNRGWSDRGIAGALKITEEKVRTAREKVGLHAAFLAVDTCAAEFEAETPYLYSSYKGTDESKISTNPKVMILGGGPNRIGQGIEFDYCCVHASKGLKLIGIESIMVNCNPETVSTDFDTSDKLYFEPLTPEHVLNIARIEKPLGVIVQFGGQTPLKIARELEKAGLKILGTSVDSIDLAEDRERFTKLVEELKPMGLLQPPNRIATNQKQAFEAAKELGYPILLRPSYVLGGRGMKIVYNEKELKLVIAEAIQVSDKHPVLIDSFLDEAIEVDVDAIRDGEVTLVAGVMEHIEEAGVHSGDSACSLPVATLSKEITDRIRVYAKELAKRLNVIGLMNAQFAIQNDKIYLLEVNPRASRTVPFISKATGVPLAKIAIQIIAGQKKLKDFNLTTDLDLNLKEFNIKEAVFPFHKFPNVDPLLGPEMKSTGEVMGRGKTFASAFAKAVIAAGMAIPKSGSVFVSIRDQDKEKFLEVAQSLSNMKFEIWATHGTAAFLEKNGIKAHGVNKLHEGAPHCVDAIQAGKFKLVINTASDVAAKQESYWIRRAALEKKIAYATVLSSARAIVKGIEAYREGPIELLPL